MITASFYRKKELAAITDESNDLNSFLDHSPTNQLAVSQVADWSPRGLVNSPTAIFLHYRKIIIYLYTEQNLTLTLTISIIESNNSKNSDYLLEILSQTFWQVD